MNKLTQQNATESARTNLPRLPSKIIFNDTSIQERIKAGCESIIAAEPTITEYDTIVGDGNCRHKLRDGAVNVLEFISSQDLSHLPRVVSALVDD